jgi:hypothetical protein
MNSSQGTVKGDDSIVSEEALRTRSTTISNVALSSSSSASASSVPERSIERSVE